MKRFRYIIALVAIVLLACNAQARTVEIKMSQIGKPMTDNLMTVTSSLTNNDQLILNFDKAGKYELNGTVVIRCDVVIKGLGPNSTKVILKDGFDARGKSKLTESAFISIKAKGNYKPKVEIRDIGFELESHKGILWEKAEKYLIRLWQCDGITIDNVVCKTRDAAITNLDLRECSNAVIENCEFENYNNCDTGGCLWSRGDQNNITVRNNIFRKYGRDEALAVWGGQSKTAHTSVTNILVENNSFLYENTTKSKKQFPTNVLICFYHFKEYDFVNTCTVDSIVFKNNNITMNTPYVRNIVFNYDNLAIVGNIEISGNRIINTSKASRSNDYSTDLTFFMTENNSRSITINNNYIKNSAEVLYNGKKSGYTAFTFKNANLNISNNIIDSDYPVLLLWCQGGKNVVNLTGNTVSKLFLTGNTTGGVQSLAINADNNELSGDTRINCNKVESIILNFTNNTFYCEDCLILLQEGAPNTSVIFDGNTVNALTRKGAMFANYSGKPYNFTKLQVTNNTYIGVTSKVVDDSFKSVKNKKISGNVYR